MSLKVSLSFFFRLYFLYSFDWQKRKQQVNGARRRKGVSLQTSEFPNNTNNEPHTTKTPFIYPIAVKLQSED